MAVIFNPVAQANSSIPSSAGYVTGAIFVLAISSLYLLRGKHVEIPSARDGGGELRSSAALSVVVLATRAAIPPAKTRR